MAAILRAGRALACSLGSELTESLRVASSSFHRVAHTSTDAAPTVSVEEEVYNRHRNIMDLGSRRVDGRYSSHAVIDPGATVVGDVDISVRVRHETTCQYPPRSNECGSRGCPLPPQLDHGPQIACLPLLLSPRL